MLVINIDLLCSFFPFTNTTFNEYLSLSPTALIHKPPTTADSAVM